MLQLVPTSRQSGAPSPAASRLMAALLGEPSSPSRLAAMLLVREADGDPAHLPCQLIAWCRLCGKACDSVQDDVSGPHAGGIGIMQLFHKGQAGSAPGKNVPVALLKSYMEPDCKGSCYCAQGF